MSNLNSFTFALTFTVILAVSQAELTVLSRDTVWTTDGQGFNKMAALPFTNGETPISVANCQGTAVLASNTFAVYKNGQFSPEFVITHLWDSALIGVSAIACVGNSSRVVVAGVQEVAAFTNALAVAVSNDSGLTWENSKVIGGPRSSLMPAVITFSGQVGLAAWASAASLSTDGGSTWTQVFDSSITPLPSITAIALADPSVGAPLAAIMGTNNYLFGVVSTDGGKKWNDMPALPECNAASSFRFLSQKNWLVTCADGTIWRTDSAAKSWTQANAAKASYWIGVELDDAVGLVAVGLNETKAFSASSKDNGVTWSSNYPQGPLPLAISAGSLRAL